MKLKCLLIVGTMAMAANGAAFADHGNARGKGPKVERAAHEYADDRRQYSRLGDYERRIVRDYYGGGNCPPGLAKKRNGCLPPGIAKKRYRVGHRLGDDIYVRPLPYELRTRLPVLPRDYGYRFVDGDLVVIELATLIVLDALGYY